MVLSCERILSARRYVRALTIIGGLLAACHGRALAQEEAVGPEPNTTASPFASFQYATLTGTTNTVNASLLPVVNSSGVTVLENVTLNFGFNSSGQLIISSLHAVPAPPSVVSGFKAGHYCGPTSWSTNLVIAVSGPGLTSGGATEWTLANTPAAYYNTYPSSATWYVGTVTNNPIYARLSKAGVKFTGWSYGIGGGAYGGEGSDWSTNSLLGFSQVGNTLTIQSFTDNSGVDHSQPVNQITYTACTK
ncbi:MAG TPA: hypothetical protein VH351_08285 [Bryobacteraceae bacterium]|jgi:hypothetical protein|nr:hypothetical protein [Bryobacteraceae bacterium]